MCRKAGKKSRFLWGMDDGIVMCIVGRFGCGNHSCCESETNGSESRS